MDEIRKRFDQLEHKGISVKACLAEMIGTGTFVLIGLMVAAYVGNFQPEKDVMLNTLIVALAFGFGIGTVIYMIGHHSGGHVNPAVTLGMVAAGMTSPIQAVGHIVSQVLGSLIATFLLWVLVPHALLAGSHLGANVVPQHSTFFHAFLAETIGTFIVMLVILETACNKKSNAGNMAPMVIGLAFVIVIIAIAPISGASLNPARSLGPALLSGYFSHLWIYLIAPCVGSFLAAPVHLFFVSDLDTVQSRAQRALEEGSVEPLLPNTAGGTQ